MQRSFVSRLLFLTLGATASVGMVVPASHVLADTSSGAPVGTLLFRAELAMKSLDAACPAGTDPVIECHQRRGTGIVPGLGQVSEQYTFPALSGPPTCPDGQYRVVDYTVRFTVVGKGDIDLAVPGTIECLPFFNFPTPTATITAGSGLYAGASGSAVLTTMAASNGNGASGSDTWVGTLSVPHLTFDLNPPVINGAVDKTARAPKKKKAVRVRFALSADDDVDGALPVTCAPPSGARFRIGHTVVQCSALDKSGNAQAATFTITVKKAARNSSAI